MMNDDDFEPRQPGACAGCSGSEWKGLAESLAAGAEDGIGRRTFLVQSGILAAIAALSACGGLGSADVTAPSVPSHSTITVSDYPGLATVGGVAMVQLGGAQVAIVRTGTSSYLALSRVCQHQGGIVQWTGSKFVCPLHGAQYSSTGQWIGGQPARNLIQYTTTYDAATGILTIG